MNVNDFADFLPAIFLLLYTLTLLFSMLLYKIYCAKYIKLSVEICANTRITTKTIANLFKKRLKCKYENTEIIQRFSQKRQGRLNCDRYYSKGL